MNEKMNDNKLTKLSSYELHFNETIKRLSKTEELIHELFNKLDPLMGPLSIATNATNVNKCDAEDVKYSRIIENIQNIEYRLMNINGIVDEILSRLEI